MKFASTERDRRNGTEKFQIDGIRGVHANIFGTIGSEHETPWPVIGNASSKSIDRIESCILFEGGRGRTRIFVE